MGTSNIFLHNVQGVPIPALGNSDGSLVISQGTYQTKVDEVDSTTTYIGEAIPGIADGDNGWRIKRVLVSGAITKITYADSLTTFTKSWTQRATYTYL